MNPLYSNGNFDQANVVAFWKTHPFEGRGDRDHTVYKFRCRCTVAGYQATRPVQNAIMSDAASAGVRNLPVTDAYAYHVLDDGWRELVGGRLEFTRTFATLPGTWTEPNGSEVHEFPGYFESTLTDVRNPYIRLSDLRVTHTYQLGDSEFDLPEIFQVKALGQPVRFVTPDTTPTLTAYKALVAAGSYLTIDAQPKRYLGDIFEVETYAIRAK